MLHPIQGLHHVTATVDHAQPDLDFFAGLLGLRLLKQTVNFDNHQVYHFYYGTEQGTPGTIWTTFPYHGHGVRIGTKGAGQVTATAFSVPAGSLDFWTRRLRERGGMVSASETRLGEDVLVASDPSGLTIELIASDRDSRDSWSPGGIPDDQAVRGLHSVTLTVHSPAQTIELLTTMLGFAIDNEAPGLTRLAVNGGGPGRLLDIVHRPDAAPAMNGLGTVHHVALAIGTADDQLRAREDLVQRGYKVTPVLDRQYFQSIYFREPGGVLIEIATVQPGFTVDEPLDALGRHLKLPAWEEPNRLTIENGLAPIRI